MDGFTAFLKSPPPKGESPPATQPQPFMNNANAGARRPVRYGRISIGTLLGVISQMSIMSELETAMQPLVQSACL